MDKILIIYLSVVLLSCGGMHKTINENRSNSRVILEGIDTYSLSEITDTLFVCDENKYIKYVKEDEEIKVSGNEFYTLNCFCNRAFEGNLDYVEILVLYYHTTKKGIPCKRSRGEKLFRYELVDIADFRVRNPETGRLFFDNNKGQAYDMIRTIDGYPPGSYYVLYLRNVRKMTDVRMAEIMDNDTVAWAKLEYEALLYAWENGLVVLKDYGEE